MYCKMKKGIFLLILLCLLSHKSQASSDLVENTITSDQLWRLAGDAVFDSSDSSNNAIILTPDQNNKQGTIYSSISIDFTKRFIWRYQVYLGSHMGADGVGIFFHNDPRKIPVNTGRGGGIVNGISYAVIVKYDTYINLGDPSNSFSKSFWNNNDAYGSIAGGDSKNITPVLWNGNWQDAAVVWDPSTGILKHYYKAGANTNLSDADLISSSNLVHSINLGTSYAQTYFNNSSQLYFGVAGSTGGQKNLQKFRMVPSNLKTKASISPLPIVIPDIPFNPSAKLFYGTTQIGNTVAIDENSVSVDNTTGKFLIPSSLLEGAHDITISNPDNGLSVTKTITVDTAPVTLAVESIIPPYIVTSTTLFKGIASKTLSGATIAKGETQISMSLSDSDFSLTNLSELSDGQWTITVSDLDGNTAQSVLNVQKTPPTLTVPSAPINLLQSAFSGTVSSGVSIQSVTIDGNPMVINTSGRFVIPSHLKTGSYAIVATDVCGNQSTQTITVQNEIPLTLPSAPINPRIQLAKGQTTPGNTVTVGGISVVVNADGSFVIPETLATGTYSVVVSNANGDATTKSLMVSTAPPTVTLPTGSVNPSLSQIICTTAAGAKVLINGLTLYADVDGHFTIPSNLATGNYLVTVTDAAGNQIVKSISIKTEKPKLLVPTTMFNPSVSPTSGTTDPGATITIGDQLVSVDSQGNFIFPATLTTGSYVVTAQDAAGNKTTSTVYVKKTPPELNVSIAPINPSLRIISGNVVDLDLGVSVKINGQKMAVDASGNFIIPSTLPEGIFPVIAMDSAGNTITKNITISKTPPFLTTPIIPIAPSKTVWPSWTKPGCVVTISGYSGSISLESSGKFIIPASLRVGSHNVTSIDSVGNKTTNVITVK